MTDLCLAEYDPPRGRQRGDRIVECRMPAGHDGGHSEDDGVHWWPDELCVKRVSEQQS